MTRVGHKIDPELFGGQRVGAVDKPQQQRFGPHTAHDEPPGPPESADAGKLDLARIALEDVIERLRVPDGQPHVAAFDRLPEQRSRRLVGDLDDLTIDQQRRLVERLEKLARNGIELPHLRQASGFLHRGPNRW